MKKYINLDLNCDFEGRDSSYYRDLLSEGKSLVGQGLTLNVLSEVLSLIDNKDLLKVLEYIEFIKFDDDFDTISDKLKSYIS